MTAERRAFREHIRLQAAELFTLGHDSSAVAKQLRVSVRSVRRWHQAWEHGGTSALESKGSASRPKLSEALFAVLAQELAKGAGSARLAGPDLDAGPDQDADRAPVPQEHDAVGHRADVAPARLQPPSPGPPCDRARRGCRDRLGEGDLAPGGNAVAALGAWLCFEGEGSSMTPPTARTWSRRGHTPVIRVPGRSQRRFSIAALTCHK